MQKSMLRASYMYTCMVYVMQNRIHVRRISDWYEFVYVCVLNKCYEWVGDSDDGIFLFFLHLHTFSHTNTQVQLIIDSIGIGAK